MDESLQQTGDTVLIPAASPSAEAITATPADAVLAALEQAEGLTRSELASQTGLPHSTVNTVVRRLLKAGSVEEFKHASSTGGRRPSLLRVTSLGDAAFVAELGQHHARTGVVSLDGEVLMVEDLSLDIAAGQDATLELLADVWKNMAAKITIPIVAAGLAVPGPVDEHGCVRGAARMPGWNDLDLPQALKEATGLLTIIENDARASAIGEWATRDKHNDSCIYVKAGTGIGCGWISGGVVHRGTLGFAGDITHVRVQTEEARPCSCGNSGCLETMASGAAILRQLRALGMDVTRPEDMVALAKNGDPQVTALVRSAGARLGEVLSGLVNFLNPKRLVIGGSMSQMNALLAGLRTELYDRCLPMCTSQLSIETSLAGADAPLIGLSVLARQLTNQRRRRSE